MLAEINTDVIEQALADAATEQPLSREDIDAILLDYGSYIGVDDLTLDENNSVALEVEGDVDLTLVSMPQFQGIVAVAELDPELHEHPEILRSMLQANMSWQLTQGGCLAIVPGTKEIALFRLVNFRDGDLERIDSEIASFVQAVEAWQQEFELGLLSDDESEVDDLSFGTDYIRP